MNVPSTPPNNTMQGLLTSCMQHTDFKSMPSQVLCLAAAVKFTQQAEQAIESGKLSSLQVWCSYLTPYLIDVLKVGFLLVYDRSTSVAHHRACLRYHASCRHHQHLESSLRYNCSQGSLWLCAESSTNCGVHLMKWQSTCLLATANVHINHTYTNTRCPVCDSRTWLLVQAELKQQLAEYTAADWEGYRVMQLKIQALVSSSCMLAM